MMDTRTMRRRSWEATGRQACFAEESTATSRQERASRFGEGHAPPPAPEERVPDLDLERPEARREGRLRDEQRLGSPADVARAVDGVEQAEQVEVDVSHIGSVDDA